MNENKRHITTVHLGQFTRETANAIAGRLEKAGIVWWYKEPGFFSQIWEFGGVRLFVDRDRLDEARRIAQRVTAARQRKRLQREAAPSAPEVRSEAPGSPPPVPPPPQRPPD